MGNNIKKPHVSMEQIYTLAQSGTSDNSIVSSAKGKIVSGNGIDASNKIQWNKWAKRKLISQKVALSLIDAAKAKGADQRRIQKYWNTYHCLREMSISNGKVHGKYCKNRCCTICQAIRKAEMINKYLPVIQTWKEPYFVTLTVKAPNRERLDFIVNGMHKAFRQIKDKYKKRHQRGTDINIVALRSLECNFNPQTLTYNPHFHLIVPDKKTAITLVVEWQRKWTKKYTSAFAQDMRKINDNEKVLIEIIKYGSKIFTEPDVKNKKNSKIPPAIYADALDNILTVFEGRRIMQSFGFSLPKQTKPIKAKSNLKVITNYDDVIFDSYMNDWVNQSTGELFTGYTPPSILSYLLNDINMDKS
jgi:plasmid rolling circle replication initiator protein Rep